MNFKVSSTALFSRLTALSKVFNSKNSLQILDCYLFEVNGTSMSITASDSETTLVTTLELNECDQNGRFCIKAKTIHDSIKMISDQPLSMEVNMDTMEIHGEYSNGFFNIVGERADEYPTPNAITGPLNSFFIAQDALLSSITFSLFATADDEIRPAMTGICFDLTPDCLIFVGTDGRKLVRIKNYNIKSENPLNFILPKKPAIVLKGLLQRAADLVEISFSDKMARFSTSEFTLTCRLVDGRYPNYNSVIPQNNPYHAVVDRPTLIATLRRILVFSSQSSALVKLAFTQNELTVSGQDVDFATNATEHLVCDYDSPDLSIGFKGTMLIDILGSLEGDSVVFSLADPSRAGLISPAEQMKDQDVLMLLMPMMLNY